MEAILGSRYGFLSQFTDEEIAALNALYFVYIYAAGKIHYNCLQKWPHSEPDTLTFTPQCGLIFLNLGWFCNSRMTNKYCRSGAV